jgi:hypothetical protein
MNARVEQQSPRASRTVGSTWPLERVLFALSGTVILVSVLLAAAISPWWLLLTAFAGLNQLAYVVFGDCVASLVLRRVFGLESVSAR